LSTNEMVLAYDGIDATTDPLDGTTHNHVWTRRSTDNGTSWSSAYEITYSAAGFGYNSISLFGPPFQLTNGSLILPVYGADSQADWQSLGASGDQTNVYVRLMKSTDKGVTWSYFSTLAPKTSGLAFTETQITRLADGRLMALIRTQRKVSGSKDANIYKCFSSDEGATWPPPQIAFARGWNEPGSYKALLNTSYTVVSTRDRPDVSLGSTTPPIFLETNDGGRRWGQRLRLYSAAGVNHNGGGAIPSGTSLLVINSEGSGLTTDDLVIYTLSAPSAVGANGDNPGTYVGTAGADYTLNQPPLLSGTASVFFQTNSGYMDVLTSPIIESITYGTKPRIRIEAEIKENSAIPGGPGPDRYIAVYKNPGAPTERLALYLTDGFGVRTLRAGVNNNACVIASSGVSINTGTAYKVAVELDDTSLKLYVTDMATPIATTVITGTPQQLLNSSYQEMQLRVGNNANANGSFTGYISNVTLTQLPQILTTTLPAGQVGTAYSQTISVEGGYPNSGANPYTFAVTSGSLPPGTTLNTTTGVLAGTPAVAATYNFTVTATDASSQTDSQAYSVVINPIPTCSISGTLYRLNGAVAAGVDLTIFHASLAGVIFSTSPVRVTSDVNGLVNLTVLQGATVRIGGDFQINGRNFNATAAFVAPSTATATLEGLSFSS